MPGKAFVFLVLLFFYSNNKLCSQVSVVTGQVANESKQPVPFATITLIDKDNKEHLRSVTGTDGKFKMSYSVAGNYSLVVSHTGYRKYRSIMFELAARDFGIIILQQGIDTLAKVLVKTNQDLIELDGNSIVYNVSKSITASGSSAFDALKKAPGIYIDNESVITLNGKQGALILLDGKQTYLSGKELVDLLKSMPSSGIKSIEIINNPGAKYDASGSAGIINIKTNKTQTKGFNGTATVGVLYGVSVKQSLDVALNYRKKKFNIYGSYNHFVGNYKYLYGSERIQNNKTFNSSTDDTDKRKKMGTRLGVDYNINKNNTVGILLNGNFVFGGGYTNTKTDIGVPSSPIVQQALNADNDYYFQETNRYNVSLNYKFENAAGKIFNVDADYGSFNKSNANLQSNIYSNNQGILSSNLYRTLNDIGINLKGIKFDYTTNALKGLFETGAKYSDINADNSSRFFHVKSNGDSSDERRSNIFGFNEKIIAAYISYKKTIGKWSLQAGLRMENSSSQGILNFKLNNKDSTELIKRNFTNIFPSFSVSVKPKEGHSFSLSYSRRVDRPAYQDLNPFVYLLDELSFWQGNPFLQPQLTHRIALQYAHKSSTIVGLTFSHTDQYSTRITDTIEAVKIVMVQRNLGVQNNLSLSLTQNVSPAKWWDISFNGTLYHLHNKIAFDKYRNFDLKQLAARFNVQQTFKLPYQLTGELAAVFTSKRLTGANDITNAVSTVDVGIQRKLLNDKATVRLVFSDIYKGSKTNSAQSYDGFYLSTYGYYETRQVRLNFTYKFADSNVKGPRNRNSALDTESGRIK